MHNLIAALLSIFLVVCTATPRSFTIQAQAGSVAAKNECSFTLFHRQARGAEPQARLNYVQINTLLDHANGLTIDIAHLRSTAAFNSYSRVSATQVFAIEGLLGGRHLTVWGEDGSDEVRFEHDGLSWSTSEEHSGGEARCEVGIWSGDEMVRSRERKMDCAFPCAKAVDGAEEQRIELR